MAAGKFGVGDLELVLKTLVTDRAESTRRGDLLAVPGVEITHAAKRDYGMVAKALDAKVVYVHGTIVEPVGLGTNNAVAVLPMWIFWPILG